MANTFKRVPTSVSINEALVYTVPEATTAVLIGFNLANKLGTMITVTIKAAGKVLGKALPIPAGSSLGVLEGKLVLEAGDTVQVTASDLDSVDVLLSVMEIS